ncbi:unnamed protein product, partial [marine sediment metagenome]
NSLGNPPLQPAHPLDNFAPRNSVPVIGMVWEYSIFGFVYIVSFVLL